MMRASIVAIVSCLSVALAVSMVVVAWRWAKEIMKKHGNRASVEEDGESMASVRNNK